MKKKYIIALIISIIVISSIISLFNYVTYTLEINKNEKILFKYFNLESTYGMTEESINDIEIYKNNSPQEYNITKLVDYYIEQLKSVTDNKEKQLIQDSFSVNDNRYCRQYGKNFTKYIGDCNLDIKLVVEDLKSILHYKNDNWFIPITANDKIELPYSYYLEYNVKGSFEKLDKVKRIQSVHLIDKFIINNSEKSKIKTYNINIGYIDNNNIKQDVVGTATYNSDNKLWAANLYNFYYKLKPAEIRLCHHAYDKEREEEEKRINEEMEEILRRQIEHEESLSIEERYFNPVFG